MYCFNRQWDNICIGRQYNNATQTTKRGPSWPHLCLCNECPVQNVNKSNFGESIILISLPFISVLYLFKHNTWHKTRDPDETKKKTETVTIVTTTCSPDDSRPPSVRLAVKWTETLWRTSHIIQSSHSTVCQRIILCTYCLTHIPDTIHIFHIHNH